uniref:Uncharacterized protein n=2 Tax=Oryza TaxID=4527 RepID=A0A0E0P5I0_ORYRU
MFPFIFIKACAQLGTLQEGRHVRIVHAFLSSITSNTTVTFSMPWAPRVRPTCTPRGACSRKSSSSHRPPSARTREERIPGSGKLGLKGNLREELWGMLFKGGRGRIRLGCGEKELGKLGFFGEPSCRLSLLDRCGDGSENPVVPPRVPSILNLASHKCLDQSKFLPLIHPAPAHFTSSTVSALSPRSEPPLLASMVEVGSGFKPEDFYLFFPNTFFSVESIVPPPYDAIDVPPMTSLALHSTRSNQGPPSRLPLMVGHRRSHSYILLGYSHQNPQMLPIASVKTKVTTTEGHQSGGMVAAVLKDMGIQAWSPSGSRENEAKSSGAGSTTHHCHSSSVDSFMMGNLNFGAVGQQMSSPPLLTIEANGGEGESIAKCEIH